jgi:hypothetical protein
MVGGGVGQALGAVSSAVSLVTNPSAKNILTTTVTTAVGYAIEGSDVPLAFGTAAVNASKFAANTVVIPVFTPGASQSTTVNINGTTVQLDDDLPR